MRGSKITQKSLTDGQNEQALVKIIEQFDKLAMVTFMQSCRGLCNNCGKYGCKGVISPNKLTSIISMGYHSNRLCHHSDMNGHIISGCRKLKAEKAKPSKKMHIWRRVTVTKFTMASLRTVMKNILALVGFLTDVQMDQGPDQTLMRIPKNKCVTFNDHNEVIVHPNQHLLDMFK